MRISDWSSAVCSSDLRTLPPAPPQPGDVVLLFSPYPENPNKPASDAIPCLVTAVEPAPDAAGKPRLIITPAPCGGTGRSEARRVGNGCVSTCRSRLPPSH